MNKSYLLYFILYIFFNLSTFAVHQDTEESIFNIETIVKAYLLKLTNDIKIINNLNSFLEKQNAQELSEYLWEILDKFEFNDLSDEQKCAYNYVAEYANDLI